MAHLDLDWIHELTLDETISLLDEMSTIPLTTSLHNDPIPVYDFEVDNYFRHQIIPKEI